MALTTQAQEKRHFLGVLEDYPRQSIYNKETKEIEKYTGYVPIIRVVFEKKGNEWLSEVADIPTEINWTIAFDGKKRRTVTGKTLNPEIDHNDDKYELHHYPRSQEVISTIPMPFVGKRLLKYGGFKDTAVYHPLVVNSLDYYQDPDGWKPAKLSAENITQLQKAFRAKFPKVENCTTKNNEVKKPWPYQNKDIKIDKSYSSNKGWSIAELSLTDRCDEPFGEDPFNGVWFAISPEHKIKFLRDTMSLVDAGDYDNSGKSQLLFALDGYNRYGYALFYDDFTKHVEIYGSYH